MAFISGVATSWAPAAAAPSKVGPSALTYSKIQIKNWLIIYQLRANLVQLQRLENIMN